MKLSDKVSEEREDGQQNASFCVERVSLRLQQILCRIETLENYVVANGHGDLPLMAEFPQLLAVGNPDIFDLGGVLKEPAAFPGLQQD